MRDVLEKRFGLKGGRRFTLEAIGNGYKITRERVRQIETEALKQLTRPENYQEMEPVFLVLEERFQECGGVLAEEHLDKMLGYPREAAHAKFLLNVGKQFTPLEESDACRRRWTVDKTKASSAEKILEQVVKNFEENKRLLPRDELNTLLAKSAEDILGETAPEAILEAYLGLSKFIKSNPYGEYGLASWSSISPRGVKDKAYLVLLKESRPLHFRKVAEAIQKIGWSKKKAHPQTVHNELIKDSRFVLVGRGLYALREWGYEPGVVRDVVASILKKAGKPMAKDEIVRLVSEKRFVKPQTVVLNLQNRSLFKRTEEGKYTLV